MALPNTAFTRLVLGCNGEGTLLDRRVTDIEPILFETLKGWRLYWRASGPCPSNPPLVLSILYFTCCGDQSPPASCCEDIKYRIPPAALVTLERYQRGRRRMQFAVTLKRFDDYVPYVIEGSRLYNDLRDNPLFLTECDGDVISLRDIESVVSYIVNDAPEYELSNNCLPLGSDPSDDNADPEV